MDFTGDNFLAEFRSPSEAIRCVVEIQQVLWVLNANLSTERKMQFRMGIQPVLGIFDDVAVIDRAPAEFTEANVYECDVSSAVVARRSLA